MRQGLQFNSVLSRLLFFNVALVLLVTVLPQVILYSYFSTNYQRQLEDANAKDVARIRELVDKNVMEMAIFIPNLYFSKLRDNSALTYPLNFDISKQAYRILEVSAKIDDITSSCLAAQVLNDNGACAIFVKIYAVSQVSQTNSETAVTNGGKRDE